MEKQKVLNILKHLNDGKERGDDYLIGLVDGLFFEEEQKDTSDNGVADEAVTEFVDGLVREIHHLDAGARAKEQPYLDGFNNAKAKIVNRFLANRMSSLTNVTP